MRYSEKDLKIQELAREIDYMKKEHQLEVKDLKNADEERRREIERAIIRVETENGHLKACLEESPSKLLQGILKALTVKIPTLNIESLSVNAEKK